MHTITLYPCAIGDVLRMELFDRATEENNRVGDLAICGPHSEDAHALAYVAFIVTRTTSDASPHPCGTLHVFCPSYLRLARYAFTTYHFTCSEWPCLRPQGHIGLHGGGGVGDFPSPRIDPRATPDILIAELTAQLGNPINPRRRLAQASVTFAALDDALRAAGGALHPRVPDITPADACVTRTYDTLSEALRDPVTTDAAAYAALETAATAWQTLREVLTQGGPLPEPWRPRP